MISPTSMSACNFRSDGKTQSHFCYLPEEKSKQLSTALLRSFLALFPAFIRTFRALNTGFKLVSTDYPVLQRVKIQLANVICSFQDIDLNVRKSIIFDLKKNNLI